MPQLPITPVTPQSPGVSSGKSTTSSSGSDGGAGLDGAQGQNFGEVLTQQIKKETSSAAASEDGEPTGKTDAVAASPVDFSILIASSATPVAPVQAENVVGVVPPGLKPAEAGLDKPSIRSFRADEGDGKSEKPDALAILPVDPSTVTASPFVPVVPAQVDSGVTKASVEIATDKTLTQHSRAKEIRLAAKTAGDGKELPVVASPQKEFAGKLAAMADVPVDKTGAPPQAADLSAAAQMSAAGGGAVGALQRQEQSSALSVAPRVGSAEWGGAVGEKVLWMANQSHQVAELHLNPPNLGPLEVRLTMNNDQASAIFVSHHAAVREAIETAMPRLREMLADNGIMLGNTTVGSESFSQQQASDQRGGGARADRGMEEILARISGPSRPVSMAHDGMVDIFA